MESHYAVMWTPGAAFMSVVFTLCILQRPTIIFE